MRLLLIFLLTFNISLFSQTGPNDPSTSGTNSSIGTIGWNNTGNILSSDNSRSFASLNNSGDASYYLTATDFGFSIPATDIIDGIEIEIERSDDGGGGNIKDNSILIIKGGSISGTEKAAGSNWPSSDTYKTYGGSTDLWGLTWTAADINATNFGISISTRRTGGGANNRSRIDHIRITIHHSPDPLPIELLSFSGVQDNNSIKIDWVTASETNNDYFILEKSIDGINFNTIGKVNGIGNSSVTEEYNFIDNHPFRGTNYYRLSQTDFNGQREFFRTIEANYLSKSGISIYPNPSSGRIRIQIESDNVVVVSIIDSMGRINLLISTASDISIDLELTPGLYTLSISLGGFVSTEKIIIK